MNAVLILQTKHEKDPYMLLDTANYYRVEQVKISRSTCRDCTSDARMHACTHRAADPIPSRIGIRILSWSRCCPVCFAESHMLCVITTLKQVSKDAHGFATCGAIVWKSHDTAVVNCQGRTANYVMVERPGVGALEICEIEVQGRLYAKDNKAVAGSQLGNEEVAAAKDGEAAKQDKIDESIEKQEESKNAAAGAKDEDDARKARDEAARMRAEAALLKRKVAALKEEACRIVD